MKNRNEPPGRCRTAGSSAPAPQRASPWGGVQSSQPLTCLDLFCGCGGFTMGMQRAGFHVLAAIEFNPQATATLRANPGRVQLN